jgi:F-type H+-transporting ATPase subunit a
MLKNIYCKFLIFFFVGLACISAKESLKEPSSGDNLKAEIKKYILHHLQDNHDFNLLSYTNEQGEKVHIGAPLPVILWDEGLKIFSSSKFHHGKSVASVGDKYYKLDHGQIYNTDATGTINYDDSHHATNIAPLDLSITKGVVSLLFTALMMFFLFKGLADSYRKNGMVAKGIGRYFEPIVIYIRDEIAIPNIGEKHHRKFMGYLLTLFFFVWFLNLLGLTPLGINVTGNIAITFCLALITFVITNISGKKRILETHILDARSSMANENSLGSD